MRLPAGCQLSLSRVRQPSFSAPRSLTPPRNPPLQPPCPRNTPHIAAQPQGGGSPLSTQRGRGRQVRVRGCAKHSAGMTGGHNRPLNLHVMSAALGPPTSPCIRRRRHLSSARPTLLTLSPSPPPSLDAATTLTAGRTGSSASAYFWPTRSNTRRTSSCCAATTSAPVSTEFTDSTTNVSNIFLLKSPFRLSVHQG